jgi:hypothetical protein
MSAARRHRFVDLIDAVEQVEGAVIDIELAVIERGHGIVVGRTPTKLREWIDIDRVSVIYRRHAWTVFEPVVDDLLGLARDQRTG